MGRKYKFHDNSKLYFVTFMVIDWIDAFTRNEYTDIIYDSIKFCQRHKGLEVYAYCIMTNHIYLIIGTENNILSNIVRDFKSFTSEQIRKEIIENSKESRKNWMLDLMVKQGLVMKETKIFNFGSNTITQLN